MKKFFALLLAAMMLLTMTAVATAEEAGFDEYELGVEGDYEGIGNCVLGFSAAPVPEGAPRRDNRVYWAE